MELSNTSNAGRGRGGWPLRLATLFLLASILVSGCEKDAGPLPANQPPTTFLQIQGRDVDTLGYRQILRWWGSDPDGDVIGYCVRWDGEWRPDADASRCAFDSSFAFTTVTLDTFAVPIGGAFGERTFTVHAVDNLGIIDPVGKSQLFRLSDWPPVLDWSQTLARPNVSLPAVSFAWTFQDLDGRETVTGYRYWLDGQNPDLEASATTDTVIALGVEDFEGRYGKRSLFAQAIDEAQARSNIIEHTWTVDAPPRERYLLIDNVNSSTPGEATEDGYYRAILDSVAAGDYFVYDVEERGDFRTDREVAPLLSLFEGVLWYGGNRRDSNDASVLRNLRMGEAGMRSYLSAGGHLVLAYRDAVADAGGLSSGFARDILGVEDYFRDATGTTNIRLGSRVPVVTSLLASPGDTLQTTSSSPDAEFFTLAADVEPLFWVAPAYFDSTVTPDQSERPAYLGVLSRREQGNLALVTYLLSRSDGRSNGIAAGRELLRRAFSE